jgi:hypothetical protein
MTRKRNDYFPARPEMARAAGGGGRLLNIGDSPFAKPQRQAVVTFIKKSPPTGAGFALDGAQWCAYGQSSVSTS